MDTYRKDMKKVQNDRGTGLEESLRRQLKITREKRHLTREEVSEGLISAGELRRLEEGRVADVWLLRLLMGRLHILPSVNIFYLSERDNALANLESEIRCSLLLWNYEKAENQLKQFTELCDKWNRFQQMIFYRLDTALRVRLIRAGRSSRKEKDVKRLRRFMEENMAGFEERLLQHRLFSPEELALLSVYYDFTIENTAEKLKKLYFLIHYFRDEFSQEEKQYLFYADLILACAQCQYAMGEFQNCIRQCEKGLELTEYFHTCEATGELCELIADAKGELFAKEIVNAEERKPWAGDIFRCYMQADAVYDTFYFGYQDGYREKLREKAERWKTIMLE